MTVYGLDYQHVPIHAAGWAPTERQADGTWSTAWAIRLRESVGSMTDVVAARLDRLAVEASQSDPAFVAQLRLTGDRGLVASIRTPEQGQDAAYWGPTYALLISVETGIGRIWLLNDSPRLWYPPFQIEQSKLLGRLSPPRTATFLANCLERLLPLFRATAPRVQSGESALFEQAVRALAPESGGSAERERIFTALTMLPDYQARDGAQALGEIRREAVTSALAALRAASTNSAQLTALCARKAFDAAYLFDTFVALPEQEGIAYREDDLWWRDANDLLADDDPGALARVRARTAHAAAANEVVIKENLGGPGNSPHGPAPR